MSDLVDSTKIERVVGAARQPLVHIARADSRNRMVYILHSQACKDSGIDLRECAYSLALDTGIDDGEWWDYEDRPVVVRIFMDRLVPYDLIDGRSE